MGNPTAFITKSKIHQDSIDPKKESELQRIC